MLKDQSRLPRGPHHREKSPGSKKHLRELHKIQIFMLGIQTYAPSTRKIKLPVYLARRAGITINDSHDFLDFLTNDHAS